MNLINRLLTGNYKRVALFIVEFNYRKFRKYGKKGSCVCVMHPGLQADEYIRKTTNDLVDYIRDNYDMKKLL